MKRNLMKRAHEIARGLEGNYQARMSLALRQAWTEKRLADKGSLWEKYGKRRIYFNDLAGIYGLETEFYGSGSVSYATLDGETISNGRAEKILGQFNFGKLWYDLDTCEFNAQYLDQDIIEVLIKKLTA